MPSKLLLIAAGGAFGALLRYAVSGWTYAAMGEAFPWGTMAANLAGCFLIGVLWAGSEGASFSAETRAFVFTGMIGAFTTFSTFGLDAVSLMRDGAAGRALAYVVVSNVFGLALVYAGLVLGGYLLASGSGS